MLFIEDRLKVFIEVIFILIVYMEIINVGNDNYFVYLEYYERKFYMKE